MLAIFYEGVWSPAILCRRNNKHHLATSIMLSCSSRPWGCVQSQVVNQYNMLEAAAASAAAAEFNESLQVGPAGELNDDGEEQQPSDPVSPRMAAAAPPLPSRLRRARNMFPCASEVRECELYAAVIDACRTAEKAMILDHTPAEIKCMYCDTMRGEETEVLPEEVVLYCIRGRLTIYIGSWMCVCERMVEYDGSPDGLPVSKRGGVYTRTLLVAVLELCVIARSTMAAASEFLMSLLRNTAGYSEYEPGQARQLLSEACGEFFKHACHPGSGL